MSKKIAVLIGSHSATSFSQLIFKQLKQLAPASLNLEAVEIASLPLYDRDLDENSPESYVKFRQQIEQADGVIFITPEHNAGMAAMLKNAIDIGSRPLGQSKWPGKPAGIISLGAGMQGGVRAAEQVRTVVSAGFMAMPVSPNTVNVAQVYTLFNEQGELTSQPVVDALQGFINTYADFVAKF